MANKHQSETSKAMRGKWWRVLLVVALLVTAFSFATLSHSSVAHAASQYNVCFSGLDKFVYTEPNGNQHHLVEFSVNVSAPDQYWHITAVPWGYPFSSSLWPGYYQYHHNGGGPAVYKELGYQWPYNWPDPYSASSWQICEG